MLTHLTMALSTCMQQDLLTAFCVMHRTIQFQQRACDNQPGVFVNVPLPCCAPLIIMSHPQALESSLAEAFDVSRESHSINITCSIPSGGDVAAVWSAMALAGSLSKHVQGVAGKSFLCPVVLHGWTNEYQLESPSPHILVWLVPGVSDNRAL